jgi:hypothetical protein
MDTKYTNLFHCKILKITQIEIFGLKIHHLATLGHHATKPRINPICGRMMSHDKTRHRVIGP